METTELKIKSTKEVTEYFAGKIEAIQTDGEETSNFIFTYDPVFGTDGIREFALDFTGNFSREYDYEKGDRELPESYKLTSQSIWDTELNGFIDGLEIEVSNANEVCSMIEKIINK